MATAVKETAIRVRVESAQLEQVDRLVAGEDEATRSRVVRRALWRGLKILEAERRNEPPTRPEAA